MDKLFTTLRDIGFIKTTPQSLLPEALKDENPFNILRLVNGEMTRNKIQYEKLMKKKRPMNGLFFYYIYY